MVSPCQRMCVALLLFMAISGAAAFQIQAGSIFGSSRKLISSHSGASAARALRWRSRPCGDALLIRMRADSSEISGAYSEDSESFNPITSEELEGGDDAGVDCTSGSAHVQKCKLDLLVALAGTDRGAAAGAVQRKEVVTAAEALERESRLQTFPAGLPSTDGLWRLVYSSALSAGSGSGGGAGRDSPAVFQTPDTGSFNSFGPGSQVGQVYARISSRKQKLENIVEVFLRAPVPFLPFQLGKLVLNLEHRLEVIGDKQVKITLENITAKNPGGPARQLRLPPLKIPVLEALSSQGAGVFETTYCDGSIRITRGDRGEVRIFTKA